MGYKLKWVKIKPKKQKETIIKPQSKDIQKPPLNPKIKDFYENEVIRLKQKKMLKIKKERYYRLKAEVEPNILLTIMGYSKKRRKKRED